MTRWAGTYPCHYLCLHARLTDVTGFGTSFESVSVSCICISRGLQCVNSVRTEEKCAKRKPPTNPGSRNDRVKVSQGKMIAKEKREKRARRSESIGAEAVRRSVLSRAYGIWN
jgi:hypothetical protein